MFWIAVALAGGLDVEQVVAAELERAQRALVASGEPLHYAAVAVLDREVVELVGVDGALSAREVGRERALDVDLRMGSPALDSTHELRGDSAYDDDGRWKVLVAYDGPGEAAALRRDVWAELDRAAREAKERLTLVKYEQIVRVEEEDPAPDFEPRAPVVARPPLPAPLAVDLTAWEATVRDLSAQLLDEPGVTTGQANLRAVRDVVTFVDTEGAHIVHGRVWVRVGMQVSTVADDGDVIELYDAIDAHALERVAGREVLLERAQALAARAAALARAPRAAPYTGPVWLSGRAAGVFFHEVMGHRVEGHRQKSDGEGKTFLEQLGRPVLPAFIDVVDDPTRARWGDIDLNGHYAYDDEGVPAQPALLVEDGVFRGFLLHRSPIAGFTESNGHGRRAAGRAPVARMGNTIVSTSQPVSEAELRRRMVAELKAQGLPYGYRVDEIAGGFTLTGRGLPNSFNVMPRVAWRVYADGRPDELVRGVDLVGTPLAAFQSLLVAGGEVEVFNGVCGAESGWVPVSAVAPAMVFRRLELQLQDKSSNRPPLRPRPGPDGAVEASW